MVVAVRYPWRCHRSGGFIFAAVAETQLRSQCLINGAHPKLATLNSSLRFEVNSDVSAVTVSYPLRFLL